MFFGNIKTIIFDKKEGTLTVKKRSTFCNKRKIVTYWLKDITDVRAVMRGYKSGSVDTQSYSIIIEFHRNAIN